MSFRIIHALPSIDEGLSFPADGVDFSFTFEKPGMDDLNSAGLSGIESGVVINPAIADAATISGDAR